MPKESLTGGVGCPRAGHGPLTSLSCLLRCPQPRSLHPWLGFRAASGPCFQHHPITGAACRGLGRSLGFPPGTSASPRSGGHLASPLASTTVSPFPDARKSQGRRGEWESPSLPVKRRMTEKATISTGSACGSLCSLSSSFSPMERISCTKLAAAMVRRAPAGLLPGVLNRDRAGRPHPPAARRTSSSGLTPVPLWLMSGEGTTGALSPNPADTTRGGGSW